MKPAYYEIADILHERAKERAAAEAADVAALERPTKHVSRETMARRGSLDDDIDAAVGWVWAVVIVFIGVAAVCAIAVAGYYAGVAV